MGSLYSDTVNELSHQEGLKNAVCDNCGEPAKRWFGSTSVRICNNPDCRERYQREWDAALLEASSEEEEYRYNWGEEE